MLSPNGARAKSIAIDFGVSVQSAMGPTEVAGVVSQSNWNSFGGATGSQGSLLDNSGSATSTSVSWTSNGLYQVQDGQTDTPGNQRMMYGYLDTDNATTTSVSVSGIPSSFLANGYDVYVYFDGSNGADNRTGQYTLVPSIGSSLTKYGRDAGNTFYNGTFVEANSTVAPTTVTSAPAGNYIHFSALIAGGFTLNAIPSLGEGFQRAPVNGIEIVALAQGSDFTLTDGSNIGSNVSIVGNLDYVGSSIAATMSGNVTFTSANSTHNINVNDGAASPDLLISGTLSSTTELDKRGNGVLRIAGANSNLSGGLSIYGGSVEFAGTGISLGQVNLSDAAMSILSGDVTESGTTLIVGSGSISSTVNQSGGTFNVAAISLGWSGSSGGIYNLSNGTLNVTPGELQVGGFGRGTFNQTGGSVSASSMVVGDPGGTGAYNLSSGTLNVTGATIIGKTNGSQGTVVQTGGLATFNGGIVLGQDSAPGLSTNGVYNLSGAGVLTVTGSVNVSENGIGALNQYAGSTTINTGDLVIGSKAAVAALKSTAAHSPSTEPSISGHPMEPTRARAPSHKPAARISSPLSSTSRSSRPALAFSICLAERSRSPTTST